MKNKNKLLFIILTLLCSCNSDKQDSEISRLKDELLKKNNIYIELDKSMKQIDKSMSDIEFEKADIDSMLKMSNALKSKDKLLIKINLMVKYAEETKNKIKELEKKLENSQENQGLYLLVSQLKKELISKDALILNLKEKVTDLENNLVEIQKNLREEQIIRKRVESENVKFTKDKDSVVTSKDVLAKDYESYKNNPIIKDVDVFADIRADPTGSLSRKMVKKISIKFTIPKNRHLTTQKKYTLYIDFLDSDNDIYQRNSNSKDSIARNKHTTKYGFIYQGYEKTYTITFDRKDKLSIGKHTVRFLLDGVVLKDEKLELGKNANISFDK